MNILPDLIGAILISLFAILSIKTWDIWRVARANRKSEASALSKRQHDAAVAAQLKVLREALFLLGGKK